MQLTLFTDYGLRSLMYLAQNPDRLCSVKEISEYYAISRHHLVKIIHRLAQLGYIESTQGKGGGIKLAAPIDNLHLGDLVKKLEPNMTLVECFDKKTNTCKITNTCTLKHYLHEANEAFLKTLNQYTLSDTLNIKSNQPKKAPNIIT